MLIYVKIVQDDKYFKDVSNLQEKGWRTALLLTISRMQVKLDQKAILKNKNPSLSNYKDNNRAQ